MSDPSSPVSIGINDHYAPGEPSKNDPTAGVLREVLAERRRQDARWGEQNHPNGTGYRYLREQADKARRECDTAAETGRVTWRLVLREEYREALACTDPAELREELLQVAAVAVVWIEALDRRAAAAEGGAA